MKIVYAIVLFATLSIAQSSIAQNIAHINTSNLLAEMPSYKLVQLEMEKISVKKEQELRGMQIEFQKEVNDYTKGADTLSDIVRQFKEKELQEKRNRIEQFAMYAEQELKAKEEELTQPIVVKATAAINKVAKANGYEYVIDSSAGTLIVVPKKRDITDLVKKELGI